MKSKVTVTADKVGSIISVSKNNPEWGHIRVEQNRMSVDDNGFSRLTRHSALIACAVADLVTFGFTAGQELSGNIIVRESVTPFDKTNPERDLKIAGSTGVICMFGDKPIFRKNFYAENPSKMDETLEHTNQQEIQEARASQKASALAPSTEFGV